jgi:hypothetical protein
MVILQFGTDDILGILLYHNRSHQNNQLTGWNESVSVIKRDLNGFILGFMNLTSKPLVFVCTPPPVYSMSADQLMLISSTPKTTQSASTSASASAPAPASASTQKRPKDVFNINGADFIATHVVPEVAAEVGAIIINTFDPLGGSKRSKPDMMRHNSRRERRSSDLRPTPSSSAFKYRTSTASPSSISFSTDTDNVVGEDNDMNRYYDDDYDMRYPNDYGYITMAQEIAHVVQRTYQRILIAAAAATTSAAATSPTTAMGTVTGAATGTETGTGTRTGAGNQSSSPRSHNRTAHSAVTIIP